MKEEKLVSISFMVDKKVKDELRQLARQVSIDKNKDITISDLVREAVFSKYKGVIAKKE
ncbi:MAG: hypothetical protein ACYCSB_04155 [bacterium]